MQAYSLVSIMADNDACEMHALVQFCTQVWLSPFSDAKYEYAERLNRQALEGRKEEL